MILVLGDGLLATELIGQTAWNYVSRKEHGFDITKPKRWSSFLPSNVTTIVNCIANTDTYSSDPEPSMLVNYHGVMDLVKLCNDRQIKLVHYSTDYVYANSISEASETDLAVPADNWYSKSKLMADEYIMNHCDNYLICRGSHKVNPFPWNAAWDDQWTNADYVDVMAKIFAKMIREKATGLYNIGTEKKTIYDLALRTNPDVEVAKSPYHAPKDVTMNLTKMNNFFKTVNNE